MFDVGFSELVMIGLVSLLVIGPERLPKVARLAGFWIGKSRAMLESVKTEIHNELQQEELRQLLNEQANLTELHSAIEEIKDVGASIESSINTSLEETHKDLKHLDERT